MESHLLQMRGLKQRDYNGKMVGNRVASFTDAWIETLTSPRAARAKNVASFTDAWIETVVR